MDAQDDLGPDLVIAGAARSGTSYLASVLAEHPAIDAGSVKESNYFSRENTRGGSWYDGLYKPRRRGLLRLDASMSYTYPHFPDALVCLATAAPHTTIVYAVREPIMRALSHYQLHRDTFRIDESPNFGAALHANPIYAGTSDYARWLPELAALFPAERRLIVPFELTTTAGMHVAAVICQALGIEPLPEQAMRDESHRNDVVAFRSTSILKARRQIRRSGVYPWIRRTVGPDRMRWIRSRLTRPVTRETLATALNTCSLTQLRELDSLYARAQAAVAHALDAQDMALGLDWGGAWSESVSAGRSPVTAALERSADRDR